jgi:serine/threonine protein kinase
MEDFPRPRHVHKYRGGPPYEWNHEADPASGSHCIVRKAVSTLTNKVVAIKTISMASTQKHRKRILRELGVLELCDHPNLIRLMDAYETDDGKIHLVTAPWAPFTLLDFLTKSDRELGQRCPWFKPASTSSQRIIVRLFDNLAAGVEELHRMSIKHKDLKPDNILLYREESGEEVRAIITDCGVSKFYRDGGYTNFIHSTYTYLAPEQLDKVSSSLKADIWQLGCCFSLALTQVCGGSVAVDRLWDSFTNTEDHRACTIAQELVHFLRTLREVCSANGHLLKLIMGMLEEDPTHRWDIKMVRAGIRDLK